MTTKRQPPITTPDQARAARIAIIREVWLPIARAQRERQRQAEQAQASVAEQQRENK